MPDDPPAAAMPPDLAFLVPFCRPARRYRAGEAVFRAGEAAEGLFILDSGRVHLLRPLADGAEALVHRALPGSTFAEAAVFAAHYHCDAVAAVAAQARLVPRAAVRDLLASDPAFAAAFAARLAGQVQDLRARVEVLSIHGAAARVMAHLAQHARTDSSGGWEGEGQSVELGRPLRRLAAEIGLTQETLYRTLGRLVREGRIVRTGRSAYRLVPDPGRMHSSNEPWQANGGR